MKNLLLKKSLILLTIVALWSTLSQAQVCTGDFELNSQAEVDAFACTSITGNLTITGADIDDLSPLSSLETIGGNLFIHTNPNLTSLNGFSALTSIGGSLSIQIHALLADLSGFSSLTSVGYNLAIYANAVLPNLDGLSSLTSLGGGLYIESNASLLNIDGLSSMITSGGAVVIANNGSLANLDGLISVTAATDLKIQDNASLTNLNGLSSIGSVQRFLYVTNNTSLTEFCGLYACMLNGVDSRNLLLRGNRENPTKAQIIANGPCPECAGLLVKLIDSKSDPLTGGSLEYREGGGNPWLPATEINDGVWCIETEKSNVGLRMTFGPQVQKEANIPTGETYTFQTVKVTVALEDAGSPVDGGEVDYTSGGWYNFGTTGDDGAGTGTVSREMLPLQYTFRMKYNRFKENKTEIISSSNNLITFDVSDLKTSTMSGDDQILLSTYPNPVNSNATIAYSLEKAQDINISVYDQTGRLIEVLQDGFETEGNHKIIWDASQVKKGIYFLRLTTNGRVMNKNMVKF